MKIKTKFGISFSDELGNKISIDDIISQMNDKLSMANMLGWSAIVITISLSVPSALGFVAFNTIMYQDARLNKQDEELNKQDEELNKQYEQLKKQDEELSKLREKLHVIDKEVVKLTK